MVAYISKKEAIQIMEEKLEILKSYSDTDTFLLLSYDLRLGRCFARSRIGIEKGKALAKRSKTFVLDKDNTEDEVSVLSMYSEKQNIKNIIPIGEKHDVLLIPENINTLQIDRKNKCSKKY